jgi:ATP-dependent RNA helicase DBP3
VAEFLDLNEIKIVNLKGEALKTKILTSYKTAAFPKDLRRDLKVFKTPTPIQAVSIPVLMDKSDLVGIAKTGSGKTMAFGLPGILHLNNSIQKPQVLVLSPTRELAMQIQEQFNIFGKSSNISTVCIYGGVPKKPQQDLLRQGASTIIATPGRLIDLFESDSSLCDLSSISYLVLDEADRMLDAGFEDSIKKIIAKLPAKRQTVMFSATWPSSIQKMAMAYLNNPVKV